MSEEITKDKAINCLRSFDEIADGEEIALYADDLQAFIMGADALEKLQKIEQIVMKSPDEFKQCGLKELKQILEVLAYE